jgi:hypothetical protein
VHVYLLSYADLACGSVHVRILEEANKEEEELLDIAPHWGEPRISCVDVLCAMIVHIFSCIFLVHYYDR